MLAIGLTGGIGSGKSSVSQRFEQLDIPVIDADIIAREITLPHSPAALKIRETFGAEYFFPDRQLNRAALRQHVFDNPENLKKLENILHPAIGAEIQRQKNQLASKTKPPPYCILAIPLLIESNMLHLVDHVIVVDLPIEQQITRVMMRDRSSKDQVKKILSRQLGQEDRLKYADWVIDNSGTLAALDDQINALDYKLRSMV